MVTQLHTDDTEIGHVEIDAFGGDGWVRHWGGVGDDGGWCGRRRRFASENIIVHADDVTAGGRPHAEAEAG